MCGITGWATLDPRAPAAEDARARLHAMCDRLLHRGPDAEGLLVAGGVALGMRRLAVIDLVTGDQPVFNEDRSVAVVANGEIYNYRELRLDLERRGHRFDGRSDTEVLPHLYELHGDAMVEHLNGMFAFALWDARRRRLLLARDRFGEKPLYWGIFAGALLFASEPKALLAHPAVARTLDRRALRRYLAFDYVPAPLSIWQGVHKLPAAHTLALEDGATTLRAYWRLPTPGRGPIPREDEAAERLRELLAEAVRIRMVSDVPLGVFLSGGIDSSTVAALAARVSPGPIRSFSISFAEPSFDESAHARSVARYLGTEHHEARLDAGLAAGLLADLGARMDEPFSDPSLLPAYLLSRFARRQVTVALGGDGADELFAGYPMYPAHRLAGIYARVPGFVRTGVIEPLVRRLPVRTRDLSFDLKAKRFVAGMRHDPVARHHVWFGSFAPDERMKLLAGDGAEGEADDVYAQARGMLDAGGGSDVVARMQYLDTQLYLADDILTKVDRASMAASLEVRAPFLDPRVAEYAASLPVGFKLRGWETKSILKRSMGRLLPRDVTRRRKKGFGVPIAQWLAGPLRPLARELLSPARLRLAGLFDVPYVTRLLDEHERSVANHGKLIWTLLMFELWHEHFMRSARSG